MKNPDPKVMAENERKELQDRYIRFDWAIKQLLRQKTNFDVLNGFLTVMLREEVKILEILESEGNQERADDKYNRVDIKALNSKGEIIIVEIQNTREVHYLERILYGVAKAITEHISLGEGYQKVIMIQNDVLDTAKWEGRLEGLAEGEAKGKTEALRQTAANMKRIGMEIKDIVKCTGLSAEEIER